jgi:hypothetical protein
MSLKNLEFSWNWECLRYNTRQKKKKKKKKNSGSIAETWLHYNIHISNHYCGCPYILVRIPDWGLASTVFILFCRLTETFAVEQSGGCYKQTS